MHIDQEIDRLEDRRLILTGRVRELEGAGMRWEFESGRMQEAKNAFEEADAITEEIKFLDKEIEAFKKDREQLLQHP